MQRVVLLPVRLQKRIFPKDIILGLLKSGFLLLRRQDRKTPLSPLPLLARRRPRI
jgi:hypothetical protein